MQSHLTRHVFRRLLANKPIVHRGCLRRRSYSTGLPSRTSHRPSPAIPNGAITLNPPQCRGFLNFNMFGRGAPKPKEADMDPGIETMMELEKLQNMRARLLPAEDVVAALTAFFNFRKTNRASKMPLEDTQAELVLKSIKFLQSEDARVGSASHMPTDLLRSMLFARLWRPKKIVEAHIELARTLYEELAQRIQPETAIHPYCRMLCLSGHALKARDMLLQLKARQASRADEPAAITAGEDAENQLAAEESADTESISVTSHESIPGRRANWSLILGGFARQNDETELLKTLLMMGNWRMDITHIDAATMLKFYQTKADIPQVKKWWLHYSNEVFPPGQAIPSKFVAVVGEVVSNLLRWCLANDQLAFGHEIVRDVIQASQQKAIRDAVLVWAAGTGKGVDEISRMIDIMDKSENNTAKPSQGSFADIVTINHLVQFAISRGDPYMAERFITMGKERNIEPDAQTHILQIEYRLSVNDIDGALTSYKNLQNVDLSTDQDVPVVNRLIVALCNSKRHDFDTIMNVAADLSDRKARFEPSTVSVLSFLHLSRDEHYDTLDLLNTHAFHFSSTERESIRNDLVAFCVAPTTSTAQAWGTYLILRKVFDEMPREPRTDIMVFFLERKRPDIAVHIFNHMRQHSRVDTIPSVETYVRAFLGTARLGDLDSLEVIHNQLKLDFNINVSTYLRNALIIAYTKCEQPRQALGFWDDIVASREGPSYNSVHVALRACENSAFGDVKAREIWAKLRKMNIELDGTLWASYVAALAGNGDADAAIATMEEAESKGELVVDAFVLGSLYAAVQAAAKQKSLEAWAKERYAGPWAELEQVGLEEPEHWDELKAMGGSEEGLQKFIDEMAQRKFRIDRSVTP